MKKEGKSIRNLLIGILVLMMSVCLLAGCETAPAETTAPADTTPTEPEVVADYNVYFNYGGVVDCEVDDDGTIHLTMYNKGRKITVRAADFETAGALISNSVMMVTKDENQYVTGVVSIEELGASYVTQLGTVTAIDGKKVTVNEETTFTYADTTYLTDVTGKTKAGMTPVLRVGDRITAVANAEGVITDIVLVVRGAETKEMYCPHCCEEGAVVEFTAWYGADTGKLPTASGHWYLVGDFGSANTTIAKNAEVVLDLNGYTVRGGANTQVYVLSNEGSSLHLMDSSEAGTGKICGSTANITAAGGIIDVDKGYFCMYSGTIDASMVTSSQTGAAVYLVGKRTMDMYGGKIIGGTCVAAINDEGADAGGRGGAINMAAKSVLNMYGGEIVGGKSVAGDAQTQRAQGAAIYMYADATLNMTGGSITSGTADQGGACVYAETGAVINNNGGTIEEITQPDPAPAE